MPRDVGHLTKHFSRREMERRRGMTAMVALGPIQPNLIDGLKPWAGFQNVPPTCCAGGSELCFCAASYRRRRRP